MISASHLGAYRSGNRHVQWGLSYQFQEFYDRMSEWELIDSAGYAIPYNGEVLELTKSCEIR